MRNKVIRHSAWAMAVMTAFGIGAAFVSAAEEKVDIGKVPPFIKSQIEEKTKGGKIETVTKVTTEGRPEEEYSVKYQESGKEKLLRLGPTGELLQQGEAPSSVHKEDQARVAAAKTPQEKAKVEDEIGAKHEAADRERFEAFKTAAEKEAAVHPENAERTYPGLKAMSEEYNAKDLHRVPGSELPPGVRKTFDMETLGTSNITYYKYTVGGALFYSAHYTTDAGRHIVCRVDANGKLLGKNEIKPIAPPPGADYKAVGGLHLGDLPPNIQATIQAETRGGKDMAYYKITRDGKLFYTVHYTTPESHRYDLWLDPEGHTVSHLMCVLQPGDRDFVHLELGR